MSKNFIYSENHIFTSRSEEEFITIKPGKDEQLNLKGVATIQNDNNLVLDSPNVVLTGDLVVPLSTSKFWIGNVVNQSVESPYTLPTTIATNDLLYASSATSIATLTPVGDKILTSLGGIPAFRDRILLGNGTASAPSLSFSGDTNTGIYRPISDMLSVVTSGATRATFALGGLSVTNNIYLGNAAAGTFLVKTSDTVNGGSPNLQVEAGKSNAAGNGGFLSLIAGNSSVSGLGGNVNILSGNGASGGASGDILLTTGNTSTVSSGNIVLKTPAATTAGTIKLNTNNVDRLTIDSTSITSTNRMTITDVTDATSVTNGGSLTTAGGMAVAKKLFVGEDISIGTASTVYNIKSVDVAGGGSSIALKAGNALSTGYGGEVALYGGDAVTAGRGGEVYIKAGEGVGLFPGGIVDIEAGNTTTGTGGDILLTAGNSTTNVAGSVFITGGNTTSGIYGGDVTLTGGNVVGPGAGGDILLLSGTANTNSNSGNILLKTAAATTAGSIVMSTSNVDRVTINSANVISNLPLSITNSTDATSVTNGGSFTTTGGMAVGKKLFVGEDITIGTTYNAYNIKSVDFVGGGTSLSLKGGNALSTGFGGEVALFGGDAVTAGRGGEVFIKAGKGVGLFPGGMVDIEAGNTTIGTGGDILLTAGNSDTSTAGSVFITGGNTTSGALGGDVTLTGGNVTGNGAAGDILLVSGTANTNGSSGNIVLKTAAATAAGSIVMSTNNVDRLTINSSNVTSNLPLIGPVATAAAPTYSFISPSNNTGMYSPGSDILNFATEGVDRLTIGATGIVGITNSTTSSTTTNGALTVVGGVGVGGAFNLGGNIVFGSLGVSNRSITGLTQTSGTGINVFLNGGGTSSGAGGTSNVIGGNGTDANAGGFATLQAGDSVTGTAGNARLISGSCSGAGTAGNVIITSGTTPTSSGNIVMTTPAGSSTNGIITMLIGGTLRYTFGIGALTSTTPLRGPFGSASAPCYSFSGTETGTGMWSGGTSTSILNFSTAGTNRMAIGATGGVSITSTTDGSSSTVGGSFTTAGGAAIAQQLFVGSNITIGTTPNTYSIKAVSGATGSLLNIIGGFAQSGNGGGGGVGLIGGNGFGNGNGGGASIGGGSATNIGTGGPVQINGGTAVAGTGGNVILTGGTSTSFTAGRVSLIGGATGSGFAGGVSLTGGTTGAGYAGAITLTGGNSTGAGWGGDITLTTGIANVNASSGSIRLRTPAASTPGSIIMSTDNVDRLTIGPTTITSTSPVIINNATDATSSTVGGSFTTTGGAAIAKQLFVGDNITIGNPSVYDTYDIKSIDFAGGGTSLSLKAGNAISTGFGGEISIYGGNAVTAGRGGEVFIKGGTGVGLFPGGIVDIKGGNTTTGNAGDILLTAGNSTTGVSGSVFITGGNATSVGTAGNISLLSGTSNTNATSGNITLKTAAATAPGSITFGTNNTDRFSIGTSTIASTLRLIGPSGSVTEPTYSFTALTDTGMYSSGLNNIDFTIGGEDRLKLTTSTMTSTLRSLGPDGTASEPTYTFSDNSGTGMYSSDTNNLDFSIGGSNKLNISSSGLTSTLPIITEIYSFPYDPDTFITSSLSNEIDFVVGGIPSVKIDSNGKINALVGSNFAGINNFTNTDEATSTTVGPVTIAGGIAVNNSSYMTQLHITEESDAVSLSTGALIVAGGISVGATSYFSDDVAFAAVLDVIIHTGEASIIVSGGMIIKKKLLMQSKIMYKMTGSSSQTAVDFLDSMNANVGSIVVDASTTSYNTSSDYRLKTNVRPMTDALDKIMALKPCEYTWKKTGKESNGFLAHELQNVIPEAVHGLKDEYDDYGKPIYQQVDKSFLVPTLVAAMQEMAAKIERLENIILKLTSS